MSIKALQALVFIALGGVACSVVAQTPPQTLPTANSICSEARANILRARLKYAQKPMQDMAVITRIFQVSGNDYAAELRYADDVRRKYPDLWMQSFYLIHKGEQTLEEKRIAYSVGDSVRVQGKVNSIEFVEWPDQDHTDQRPACKLSVSLDWDQAAIP